MENINEPYKNESVDNKNKYRIMLAALAILVIGLVISLFVNFRQSKSNEFVRAELDQTYSEMQVIKTELEGKIVEIERLGGDVEELIAVREEMDSEMAELKKQNQIAWSSYRNIQNRVEGYRELLLQKDEDIARLQFINEELLSENINLKDEKNQLAESINLMAQATSKLEEKVGLASRLKAENISVYAINRRGRERTGDIRSRQIEQLKIDFNISENNVAPFGGKDVLIRIIEPEGNVLFDVARGSGTFMYNGREEFFTSKQNILFDNSRQQLSFTYEKPSDFVEGRHTVEIYTDGYIMGSESFVVK
jgi:uncharacterized protein YoxC